MVGINYATSTARRRAKAPGRCPLAPG